MVKKGWMSENAYGGFFFQAEDGIRDLVRSRGLGDVYKRQSPRGAQTQDGARRRPSVVAAPPMLRAGGREAHSPLSLIHI